MRRFLRLLSGSVLLLLFRPTAADPADRGARVYARLLPSVAYVQVVHKDGAVGFGTAFLALRRGAAVTCLHVVRDAATVTLEFGDRTVVVSPGSLDRDEAHDLALLALPRPLDRPLVRVRRRRPQVGMRLYDLGHPAGYRFSFAEGRLSQWRERSGDQWWIQTTVAISPGSSGSPLVDDTGALVGVINARNNDAVLIGFAIPAIYLFRLHADRAVQPW